MKKREFKFIAVIFLIWRFIITIAGYLASLILPFKSSFPYVEIAKKYSRNILIWPWANFDGEHYLGIAEKEYAGFEQAFFPLYPLLIKILSPLFLGNRLICALFISHLSFLISLYLLYKLLKLDFERKLPTISYSSVILNLIQNLYRFQIKSGMTNIGKIFENLFNDTPVLTILFLIFFPTSFFFGSVYTESLFLMLVLLSFYSARKNIWRLAGISGMLASATRLVGIFLLPALIIEYFQQCKIHDVKFKNNYKLYIINYKFLSLLLIPLGLLCYMLFLLKTTGDPLMFIHAQAIWQRQSFILLPQVIYRYLKIFLTVNPLSLIFFVAGIEFLTVIFFIILLILGTRKLRPSYLIYGWLALLTPTLTGTFLSMPRFVLAIFPGFIMMAMIENKWMKYILFTVFCLLLIVFVFFFSRGYFIS